MFRLSIATFIFVCANGIGADEKFDEKDMAATGKWLRSVYAKLPEPNADLQAYKKASAELEKEIKIMAGKKIEWEGTFLGSTPAQGGKLEINAWNMENPIGGVFVFWKTNGAYGIIVEAKEELANLKKNDKVILTGTVSGATRLFRMGTLGKNPVSGTDYRLVIDLKNVSVKPAK